MAEAGLPRKSLLDDGLKGPAGAVSEPTPQGGGLQATGWLEPLLQGWRPYLLLIALCALVYLPGQASLPVTDRDEARFAQATRQMVASGDYIVVRFQGELRAKKPAGIYWLQAAVVRLFSNPRSTAMWPYRVPSLLAGLAAVLLTFRFGSTLLGRRAALYAAVGLATSFALAAEAHLATTDAALLAFTTLAQGSLGLIYLRARGGPAAPRWAVPAFWVGSAAAILIKGPVATAITALTLITLCVADRQMRWLRSLRPVTGLALAVLLVAPWMVAVTYQTHGVFLSRAVGEDLLPKLAGGQEGHGAPPGLHTLLAVLTLWPASLFLWPALARGWRERLTPGVRLLLAWAVPSWVMFELVPTKLPHYTLPLFPALTLLIGAWLVNPKPDTHQGLATWAGRAWAGLWAVAGAALAFVSLKLPVSYGSGFSAWALPAAVAALASLAIAAVSARQRAYLTGFLALAAAGGLTEIGLLVGVAPQAAGLWVSQRAAQTLHQEVPGAPVAVVGYAEPSMVFENGTATQLMSASEAAAWVRRDPSRVALVEEHELKAFTADLPASAAFKDRALIAGLDYSNGHTVRLHLLARATPLASGAAMGSAPSPR